MAKMVIVGAGPVGSQTAGLLIEQGHEVVAVTRSGRRPDLAGVQRVGLDAANAAELSSQAEGASALFNCANPPDYTQWDTWWPPLAESLLTSAERSGATLVTASSLYAYGPVDSPMVEGQPDRATDHKGRLRAQMWAQAKARHDAGRLAAVEVRASDYVGPGVGQNGHVSRQLPGASRGRSAWVIGSPDLPHTWTDVRDVARTLVAVVQDPSSWGQVWHAPSNAPRSQREVLTEVLASTGRPPVPVHGIPQPVLAVGGRFVPMIRELNDMSYMFRRPYVLDSRRTQQQLGLEPTPWDDVCRATGI